MIILDCLNRRAYRPEDTGQDVIVPSRSITYMRAHENSVGINFHGLYLCTHYQSHGGTVELDS